MIHFQGLDYLGNSMTQKMKASSWEIACCWDIVGSGQKYYFLGSHDKLWHRCGTILHNSAQNPATHRHLEVWGQECIAGKPLGADTGGLTASIVCRDSSEAAWMMLRAETSPRRTHRAWQVPLPFHLVDGVGRHCMGTPGSNPGLLGEENKVLEFDT